MLVLAGAAGRLLAELAPADAGASERGRQFFQQYQCAACHGPEGGGGIKNPNAKGGEVPALTKVAEGYTAEELKKKILAGVPVVDKEDPNAADPPLFMPPWKEVLSEDQVEALAAYLLSLAPEPKRGEEW